jgi:hypothetical protein
LIYDTAYFKPVSIGKTRKANTREASWDDIILHFNRFSSVESKGPKKTWGVGEGKGIGFGGEVLEPVQYCIR